MKIIVFLSVALIAVLCSCLMSINEARVNIRQDILAVYVDNCEDSLFCKFVYGFDVAMVSLAEPRLVLEIMGVVARKKPEHYKDTTSTPTAATTR